MNRESIQKTFKTKFKPNLAPGQGQATSVQKTGDVFIKN